jgi:hypothetical protein
MENLIDKIVIGLFAMCVTLGVVPIIKCLKNNAAEHIARVTKIKMFKLILQFRN